jgi:hypothetical protein
MSNSPAMTTGRNGRQPQKPIDREALARQILAASSKDVADICLPSIDMFPDRGVSINQFAVAANTESPAINVQFPTDGYAVYIAATTEDGLAASMAGTLLRVQVDGRDDLWSSGAGNGAGFKSFAQISGTFSQGYYRFRRLFVQATNWVVFINNTTSANIVADLEIGIIDTRNPPY